MNLMHPVSKLLRYSGLAVMSCARKNHFFFFVDAVLLSKPIKVELSVLLTSGGYLIIHDAVLVYGPSNDDTIRLSELKVKHTLIGSLGKQCVELTFGGMCC